MFGGKQQYSFIWFNLITYFSLHSGRDIIILKNREKIFCVAGKSLLTPNIKEEFFRKEGEKYRFPDSVFHYSSTVELMMYKGLLKCRMVIRQAKGSIMFFYSHLK
jgi:hypothetical protein